MCSLCVCPSSGCLCSCRVYVLSRSSLCVGEHVTVVIIVVVFLDPRQTVSELPPLTNLSPLYNWHYQGRQRVLGGGRGKEEKTVVADSNEYATLVSHYHKHLADWMKVL